MNALLDPAYWNLVKGNVNKLALMPEQDFTGLPPPEVLSEMSWVDLRALRDKLKTQEQQDAIAPYEHQAYTRENTSSAGDVVKNAMLTMGYTPYKVLTGEGRSNPSLRSVGQGLRGIWEGLTK